MAQIVNEFKGIKIGDKVKAQTTVGKINATVVEIIAGDFGSAIFKVQGTRSGARYHMSDSRVELA